MDTSADLKQSNEKENIFKKSDKVSSWDDMVVIPSSLKQDLLHSKYSNKSITNYTGLLNQGATCYLNSLLQVLYFTPEFRNGLTLFNISDNDYNIPYQLKLLFSRLSNTIQPYVTTNNITKSFRWNNEQSLQQHDIQEFLRVLFTSLEKFIINDYNILNILYQGIMIDYLKCLNCGYTRSLEDKFLDLSLYIKDISSVSKALDLFLIPELLNGNNQYSCNNCNNKVDAEKGLKFNKLPKILTITLKRFEFDYNTSQRIKLHHEVSFEEEMDLGKYIGLDSCKYELFAILNHSGSAMGGHYFAYIKDIQNTKKWIEFNDTEVTFLDPKVIKASYGGTDKSSAYMLMYRKISETEPAPSFDEVSDDFKSIVEAEDNIWKEEYAAYKKLQGQITLNIIFKSEEKSFKFDDIDSLQYVTNYIAFEFGLLKMADGVPDTFAFLKDHNIIDENYRLRKYSYEYGYPLEDFSVGMELLSVAELGLPRINNLMIELRGEDGCFPIYNKNKIYMKVRIFKSEEAESLINYGLSMTNSTTPSNSNVITCDKNNTIFELKVIIKQTLNLSSNFRLIIYQDNEYLELKNIQTLEELNINFNTILLAEMADDLALSFYPSPFLILFKETKLKVKIFFNRVAFEPNQQVEYTKSLMVLKSDTLSSIRLQIADKLCLDPLSFKIKRCLYGAELKDGAMTVESLELTNESIIHLEDECMLKFYIYDPTLEKRQFQFLFELPFSKNIKISAMKESLLPRIKNSKYALASEIDFIRIRDKLGAKVSRIFLDDQTLKQNLPCVDDGREIAIQKINSPEVVSPNDMPFFIQRWLPDKKTLEPRVEVVLFKRLTYTALRQQITDTFNIPLEDCCIAKGITYTKMEIDAIPKLKWNDPKIPIDSMISLPPLSLHAGDLLLVMDRKQLPVDLIHAKVTLSVVKGRKKWCGGAKEGVYSKLAKEHALEIYTEEDWAAIEAAMGTD